MNQNLNIKLKPNYIDVNYILYQSSPKIQKSHKNNTELTNVQNKMLNLGEDIVVINKVPIDITKYQKIIINKNIVNQK